MIFSMSLHSSMFITVLIIMRKLLQNKLPKKTFSVLWIITWMRLMIPYSWSSKWSIMNIVVSHHKNIKSVYMNALELIGRVTMTSVNIVSYSEPTIKRVKNSGITEILFTWKTIWGIGVIITLIYFSSKYINALKLYSEALPLDTEFFTQWKEKHYLYRSYIIKRSDQISSPLTYGFIKPVILIPKSILTIDLGNMEYILLHEWNHIRRWDTFKKWILVITLCIHWFNPLVWIMFTLASRDIELCCDEDLVRMIGESNKKKYANLLINMEEERMKLNPLCSEFGNNYMKERIVSLMKAKRSSTSMILVATILVMGVTTVFGTSGLEKLNSDPTKMPLVSEEVNIENISTNEENNVINISIPNLYGRTYEEASSIIKDLNLSFLIEE